MKDSKPDKCEGNCIYKDCYGYTTDKYYPNICRWLKAYQDGIAVGRDERQAERACPECEKTTNQTKTAETWECDGCGKEYDTFLV